MSIAVAPGATEERLKPGLEKLFRDHSQMVYRTAYAMLGNASDAEDVLQTVFLSLLRCAPEMEGSNPAGYLYRAAINGALNLIRSRRRLEFTADAERLEFPRGRATSSAVEDLHGRLTETIGELRPDDAQILILRYVQGHTDGEIAQLLGVSRGTIVMRLFRSRLRLKRLMRDEMQEEK